MFYGGECFPLLFERNLHNRAVRHQQVVFRLSCHIVQIHQIAPSYRKKIIGAAKQLNNTGKIIGKRNRAANCVQDDGMATCFKVDNIRVGDGILSFSYGVSKIPVYHVKKMTASFHCVHKMIVVIGFLKIIQGVHFIAVHSVFRGRSGEDDSARVAHAPQCSGTLYTV